MKNREEEDKSLFDAISEKYAQKDVYLPSKLARKFQFESLTRIIPAKNFQNVLEIGCGVGASSEYLGNSYKKYLGIDYAEKLIEIAKERYETSTTKFSAQNIKSLDQTDDFDLVMGVGVLHHVTDMSEIFATLTKLGNSETHYAFVEPQSGNPVVQLMRWVRKVTDKEYSEDQIYFSKKGLKKVFEENGFEVVNIRHQGYFSPPFAQIMLKPRFLFLPIARFFVGVDKLLQSMLSWSFFAWNIVVVAKKKGA